jgi:UDP-3-O-[3-hydroxymyristoyl] glucosamine N-acyltransferase
MPVWKGFRFMVTSLRDLAILVQGDLHGDGLIPIAGADTLRDARPGQIAFVDSAKLLGKLPECRATAIVTSPDLHPADLPHICVESVHDSFAKIVAHFRPPRTDRQEGIHATAVVSPSARLAEDVVVHPHVLIGDDVEIGAGSIIHAGVQIMAGCKLGEQVVLFPRVVLYEDTVLGSRVMIHGGAVLGAYGFGYTTVNGQHRLSPQLGNVVVQDDVEIGACATIDRGTYGATVIGAGTKIDNHVMIAHNCRIGRHNMICSQAGIAGSTTTGDYVVMGGQVGVRDHVHIGTGAMLGAKAGVMHDIPDGGAYVGIPATPERQQMLIQASLHKLPELKKQVKALQRLVDQLENGRIPLDVQQEAA